MFQIITTMSHVENQEKNQISLRKVRTLAPQRSNLVNFGGRAHSLKKICYYAVMFFFFTIVKKVAFIAVANITM